jgi:hypothetical protein
MAFRCDRSVILLSSERSGRSLAVYVADIVADIIGAPASPIKPGAISPGGIVNTTD